MSDETKMPTMAESMIQHIGTKLVKRSPEAITRKEYCEYRGWKLPEDEDPNELVYLVEYEADPRNKPNHPEHDGYISMSPKHVFDESYKVSETYLDRLRYERDELSGKTEKLMVALSEKKVPESEVGILSIQLNTMLTYLEILNVRLQ